MHDINPKLTKKRVRKFKKYVRAVIDEIKQGRLKCIDTEALENFT